MGNSAGISGLTTEGNATPILAYRFAKYRLLAQQQRLELNGEVVPLTTKLYHLLLTFLTRPGEVLGKDAIVDAVWPGQVVTDAALAKQIQRLRQTLHDTERDTPFIETHRGLGYRFIGDVSRERVSAPSPIPRLRPFTWRLAIAVLAAGIVLVLAVTSTRKTEEGDRGLPPALAVLPVAVDASALSEGAAEYIAARLSVAADVAPVLEIDEGPTDATEAVSLDLARNRGGPVVAVQLRHEGDRFRLWLNLRNDDSVSSIELEDTSVALLLERGAQWMATNTGGSPRPAPAANQYALASYFEGLAALGASCDRAIGFFQSALASDPSFQLASLRLARCERIRGNDHKAAAAAVALLAATDAEIRPEIALEARLIAARSYLELGDQERARESLESAATLTDESQLPLRRLSALAAMALLAAINGDTTQTIDLDTQRLALAEREYPLPAYMGQIHLDLAASFLATGEHERLREHAQAARAIAEESGDLETLVRSYRYLIASYFRRNDIDAAVQLALAARPVLDRVSVPEAKAFFMQFASFSLNLRGQFTEARAYTAALRQLAESSSNPMYGAIADFTVMHRLYVKGDYGQARILAASLRARLEAEGSAHSAIPQALAFEAIAASRGAPVDEAEAVLALLSERYGNVEALRGQLLRARGHLLARTGQYANGISLLRDAESLYRTSGATGVADYVGMEIIELRLDNEETPPWDDLDRLTSKIDFDYKLSRLLARAHALDGNYLAATAALEEARLRGNELWSQGDQLLLENYRSSLTSVSAVESDARAIR